MVRRFQDNKNILAQLIGHGQIYLIKLIWRYLIFLILGKVCKTVTLNYLFCELMIVSDMVSITNAEGLWCATKISLTIRIPGKFSILFI